MCFCVRCCKSLILLIVLRGLAWARIWLLLFPEAGSTRSPLFFLPGEGGLVIAIEIERILIAGPLSGRRAG